jgi:NADH-quinone oxidoreductase subunit A
MLLAQKYLPILMLFCLAVIVPAALIVLSSLIGPRKETQAKVGTFECGTDPVGEPRKRFSVQFFLIALLFMIFDVEVVFIFPWAVLFRKLGLYGFIEMAVFLGILIFGLFYVWKKGALEWE